MMWNPWAGAVANIGDQKLGSNPEANDTSSPSWANVSKSTQPTINESTSSDDISESILIDHPPSGEATPTPSLSRSPPPPPSNTAQTAPRTGADTQFSTAEISIDASRDNLASTSLKVVLPAGALGIRFKGYPPVIVEVFDTSPLKDTVSIGMKVLALHLPGEVRGLSNMNSIQLVTCLKDNLAKEGRVLLLEPLPDFNDDKLRPGDHIYIWKSYGMLGRAYQRHAVVYSVTKDCNGDDEDDVITVVSFYHAKPKNDTVGLLSEDDDEEDGDSAFILFKSVRVEPLERFTHRTNKKSPPRKIHKVKYGSGKSGFARRILSRGGTTTLTKPDEHQLIHHRLQYLLHHPEILPEYHDLSANGECAALWCRSGTWCTLQAASILEIMFAAQAGTAVVAGGIVSSLTVLVPVPGLLGAYGWFWYVPATVAYPFLVPLLVGYGMVSLVPLHILRKYRKQWKEMTFRLNFQFWSQATEAIRDRFFGLSQSSDDDRMTNFFGVRGGEEEEDEQDRGTYMPLNSGGCGGGDTKDEGCGLEGDAQDEDKMLTMHRDSMAAAFESDESLSDPSQNRRTSWPFQNQVQRFLRNRRTSETGMIKGMIDKKKEDDPLVASPSDVFE
mmetsp:Transcript_6910/g.8514  ORF Transcript_6910/g.8514 Transcript_6910/m.8514 type:complete len:613 (+) Transcript_6910:260-2098(+)